MNKKIAVAGTGYVGLSIATLLAQHNHKSPIQDEYIERYLTEKELDLTATLDGEAAYKDAEFVVIAAPTNYDSKKNFFDTCCRVCNRAGFKGKSQCHHGYKVNDTGWIHSVCQRKVSHRQHYFQP